MTLTDKLKTITIEELKHVAINNLNYYARKNGDAVNYLHNLKIIDNSSIENALEEAVFTQARNDYEMMIKKGREHTIWADHVLRPECLAYALNKGKFSQTEIDQIPFDHNSNAETFTKRYHKKNLLIILRGELLNPKPVSKVKEFKSCCDCGH